MKYRADIDGLRAAAVLLVFLFHADFQAILHVGFVGVDVFFVISGYLITSIIKSEMVENTFTFGHFYARRIRRLLPAMIPVCVLVFTFAYNCYLYADFMDVINTLAASGTFSANWYYQLTSGYFSAAPKTKPLLHTWSLAIEEQYYILFPPLLLLLLSKARRHVNHLILFLTLSSFASSCYLTYAHRAEAGYLNSFGRFWELMLGSLLALLDIPQLVGLYAIVARLSGFLLILLSAATFNDTVPFPGYHALVPTLGTCLVLVATNKGRDPLLWLLQSTPICYVGRISYGLYLWHWPVLVALRYFSSSINLSDAPQETLPNVVIVGGLILSFVLAAASYHFIETPFRMKKVAATDRKIFWFACGTMAILVITVSVAHATGGMPFRFRNPEIKKSLIELSDVTGIANNLQGAQGCTKVTLFPNLSWKDGYLCGGTSNNHPFRLRRPGIHQASPRLSWLNTSGTRPETSVIQYY